MLNTCRIISNDKQQSKSALTSLNKQVDLYRDKNDLLNGKVEQTKIDFNVANLLFKSKIDSLTKELNVKSKSIKSVVEIPVFTDRTNIQTLFKYDTINTIDTFYVSKSNKFRFDDNWLTLIGSVDTDRVVFDTIRTYNRLTIVSYMKRKHWYSLNKTTYVNVKDDNKHVNNLGLNTFEIQQKPKRFSLSIGVGYGFNGQRFTPNVGLFVGYNMIKF